MGKNFDTLLRQADKDSLVDAYEQLWAHQRGRAEIPDFTTEFEETLDIDWDTLEKVALRKTPRELIEELLGGMSEWALTGSVIIAMLLSPVALVLTHLWASKELPFAGFSRSLVVLLVIVVVVSLSALVIGLGIVWIAGVRERTEPKPLEAILLAIARLKQATFSGKAYSRRFRGRRQEAVTCLAGAIIVCAVGAMYWGSLNMFSGFFSEEAAFHFTQAEEVSTLSPSTAKYANFDELGLWLSKEDRLARVVRSTKAEDPALANLEAVRRKWLTEPAFRAQVLAKLDESHPREFNELTEEFLGAYHAAFSAQRTKLRR